MIFFVQPSQGHKVHNDTNRLKKFTLPSVSGTLAVESDLGKNMVIALVERPTITFPANNSTDYDNTIRYTKYRTNASYSGAKTQEQFQIATDSGFRNIVADIRENSTNVNKLSHYLPVDLSNTVIYIRMKYYSERYSSTWSNTIRVTTKTSEISMPYIVTPFNNRSDLKRNVVITTGPFSYIGIHDSHVSTTYQVARDINFNNIVYTKTTSQLTSHMVTLREGRTYYIRVRHHGAKYGVSIWSRSVRISIRDPLPSAFNFIRGNNKHGEGTCRTRVVAVMLDEDGMIEQIRTARDVTVGRVKCLPAITNGRYLTYPDGLGPYYVCNAWYWCKRNYYGKFAIFKGNNCFSDYEHPDARVPDPVLIYVWYVRSGSFVFSIQAHESDGTVLHKVDVGATVW